MNANTVLQVINQRPDPDAAKQDLFELKVEQAAEDRRVRQAAEDRVRAERSGAKAPDLDNCTSTLEDQLAEPPPEIKFVVDQLATSGAVVSLPSSRKTGKTTLVVNLAAAGVDQEPFLGRFNTHLDGNIVAVNAEMSTADYLDSYRRFGIKNTGRIIPLHCRDNGLRINLMDDVTVERFVEWLKKRDAEWLFLDPWKNFLAWSGVGMLDNDGVNRLIVRVQEIQASAGLKLTVIPMHTPQNPGEPGTERAKGAGELEDSVDAMWRYTRSEAGIDAARVLTVEGRGGARLDETVVLFDSATGRLSLGEGDRKKASAAVKAVRMLDILKANPGIKTTEWYSLTGGKDTDCVAAKNELERQGKVDSMRVGNGWVWSVTGR